VLVETELRTDFTANFGVGTALISAATLSGVADCAAESISGVGD
jgi:hypothetical protein